MEKIFEFLVVDCVETLHFIIKGQYNTNEKEFEDFQVIQVVDGEEKDYPINGHGFDGHKLDAGDAFSDVVARITRNQTKGFKLLYENDKITELLDKYRKNTILHIHDRDIPFKILNMSYVEDFELSLATANYLYYVYDDVTIMLNTETGELISDNSFAEIGFFDSLSDIKGGVDELFYKNFTYEDVDWDEIEPTKKDEKEE